MTPTTYWLSMKRNTVAAFFAALLVSACGGCSADAAPPMVASCPTGQVCPPDGGTADQGRAPDALAAHDTAAPTDTAEPQPDTVATPYVHENVTPQQVKGWLDDGKPLTIVDVREPSEYAAGHVAGALNLAWSSGVLQQQWGTLPRDRPVVVYCHSGNRSDQAATFLAARGMRPVYDMGAFSGWAGAGYPVE